MRFVVRFFVLVAVCISIGCSSSSSPPQHVSQDGSFGFDGDGWARDTSTASDVWIKGNLSLVLRDPSTNKSTDARTWAEADLAALGEPATFGPTPLRSTGAYWYGWTPTFDAKNVYEYFFVDGAHHISVEAAGPALSQSDAESLLATVRPL